jgi:hypothetical protein
MTWQPDLFGQSTDPIVGIEARMQRSCVCGREIFTVGAGKAQTAPHCIAAHAADMLGG